MTHQQSLFFDLSWSYLPRVGEARAYWSLGNAFTGAGDHRQAMHYAGKHLQLAVQLGDEEAIATAKQNLSDLSTVMELSDK